MQGFFKKPPIIVAAILGFIFLSPLILLELINVVLRYGLGFPYVLFVLIWTHQTIFIFILMPIIRKQELSKAMYIIRLVVLAVLAYIWVDIILDQWPCFMGVANCD